MEDNGIEIEVPVNASDNGLDIEVDVEIIRPYVDNPIEDDTPSDGGEGDGVYTPPDDDEEEGDGVIIPD
jgi:hypothetical protein